MEGEQRRGRGREKGRGAGGGEDGEHPGAPRRSNESTDLDRGGARARSLTSLRPGAFPLP